MKVIEAKEIVKDMEISLELRERIEEMMASLGDETEVPDSLLNQILKMMDAEIDINKIVADATD